MNVYCLYEQRATCSGATNDDKEDLNAGNGLTTKKSSLNKATPPSSLVFGYLNLFSDGVVSLCSILNHDIDKIFRFSVVYNLKFDDNLCEYCSTTLLMEWLWEVHFYFMAQLGGGLERYFYLHMSFLKRFSPFLMFLYF